MIDSIDESKCTGCGICVDSCGQDVLRMDDRSGKAIIKYPEDCKGCFSCELSCPVGAIYVHPFRKITPDGVKYPVGW